MTCINNLCKDPKAAESLWLKRNYRLVPNRRGGQNLLYNGHMYSIERKYNRTINWVCSKNSNTDLRCPARCVTAGDKSIKLSRRPHNHAANLFRVHEPNVCKRRRKRRT